MREPRTFIGATTEVKRRLLKALELVESSSEILKNWSCESMAKELDRLSQELKKLMS